MIVNKLADIIYIDNDSVYYTYYTDRCVLTKYIGDYLTPFHIYIPTLYPDTTIDLPKPLETLMKLRGYL